LVAVGLLQPLAKVVFAKSYCSALLVLRQALLSNSLEQVAHVRGSRGDVQLGLAAGWTCSAFGGSEAVHPKSTLSQSLSLPSL
jgi:hypothetical protein